MRTKLAVLSILAVVVAACAGPSLPKLETLPNGSLKVVSITLDDEEHLSRNSTVIAELEYEIYDVDEEYLRDMRIISQVATTTPNVTTDGTFPSSSYPKLNSLSGTVQFELPLRYVWYGYNDFQLKRPIEISYLLTYKVDSVRSLAFASTDTFIIEEE